MKRLLKAGLAAVMAVLMGVLPAIRVFADAPASADYVSEVKVFFGDPAAAAAEGYTLLTDGNGPVDLNQKAGGGIASKGEQAVYLGYKTTGNRDEAITDLALMNMKGGYKTRDYELLMQQQMNAQIVPFVDSFLAAIEEYRENYRSDEPLNQKRAQFVHDALNKLIDDDCGGAGLGDLLLNETKYEMGDAAYNALSEAEKAQHADILTIMAQANGNATLIMENLITRASDTNDTLWIDRFAALSYDKLLNATGQNPTDAKKQVAKLYDDDANAILDMWGAFQEHLENYDAALKILEDAAKIDLSKEVETAQKYDFETATEQEAEQAAEANAKIQYSAEELANASADVFCKEYLESLAYEDGTMLDFFSQSAEDIEDDVTVLYPLVASLTEGQRAGLDFITLQDLVMFGSTDEDGYQSAGLSELEETSIYLGVDRAIYEKGGVALTSDALRNDVVLEETPEQSIALHIWAGVAVGLSVIGSAGFIASLVVKNSADKIVAAYNNTVTGLNNLIANNTASINNMKQVLQRLQAKGATELAKTQSQNIAAFNRSIQNAKKNLASLSNEEAFINRMQARSSLCKRLSIGAGVFTVAMVALSAFLVYYDYTQMQEYYHVDFTPMPRYIIEEKDLIGYDQYGDRVVLKNQSAYYQLAECNRTAQAEFFSVLGTGADLNGDVGKQWLALYSVKKELMEPILASSLKVVVGSTELPAGYKTGLHLFGSDAAFNLNSSLFDWNNDAPSVYVYFQTDDDAASAGTAGTTFTAGTLALSGGAGAAIGAVLAALVMKKKKNDAAVEAKGE